MYLFCAFSSSYSIFVAVVAAVAVVVESNKCCWQHHFPHFTVCIINFRVEWTATWKIAADPAWLCALRLTSAHQLELNWHVIRIFDINLKYPKRDSVCVCSCVSMPLTWFELPEEFLKFESCRIKININSFVANQEFDCSFANFYKLIWCYRHDMRATPPCDSEHKLSHSDPFNSIYA